MAYQYKRIPLNRDEAQSFEHECVKFEEKLLGWVLLDTGLRISEWSSLSPKEINWQEKTLTISGKGGPFGKRSKIRTVPVPVRSMTLLEKHFAVQDQMPFGDRTAERWVKKIANRAKITKPLSPHVLRHTYAVTALMKGISLPSLQKLLGHDRLETTAIYVNMQDEHVMQEFREKW